MIIIKPGCYVRFEILHKFGEKTNTKWPPSVFFKYVILPVTIYFLTWTKLELY